MQTPTQKSVKSNSESTAVLYFRRTCEQIEHEVQNLLSDMSLDKISEFNQRSVEKYFLTFKQAIVRSMSNRLPNIIAAEQKYRTLITQINEEAENQKKKSKQIFQKYQVKVLENDKLKVQTVTLNELNDQLVKQNKQLHLKISQEHQTSNRNKQKSQNTQKLLQIPNCQGQKMIRKLDFGVQATQSNEIIVEQEEYNKFHVQFEQQKQQKNLYHLELSKQISQIQQLNTELINANTKIQQLENLSSNNNLILIEENKSNQILKEEISELLIQLEDKKNERNSIKNMNQELKKTNDKLSLKEIQISDMITDHQNILQSKQKVIKQFEATVDKNLKDIFDKGKKIEELQKKANKIPQLLKCKEELQQKYGQKLNLVTKKLKQTNEKNKHLKDENQRLYTAMDQYASNQIKMGKKINHYEQKFERIQGKSNKQNQKLSKLKLFIHKLQKQVINMKKILKNQFMQVDLKQMREQLNVLCKQINEKIERKIILFMKQGKLEKVDLQEKVRTLSQQYKELQQKCLQSEINSGKVASSLLQGKKQITKQILQRDEIIKALQHQLQKEKEINQNSLKSLTHVMSKYEKINSGLNTQNECWRSNFNADSQLDKQMKMQKNRFMNLQKQYSKMIEG